jgi:hypothetical protein
MVDRAWEDETGIHYVKDRSKPVEKPEPANCIRCGQPATCMPRVYVPCSPLAIKQIDDVSSLMAVTFCDRHFFLLKAAEFLDGETNAPVREQFAAQFRMKGSIPNFAKAVIGRVSSKEPDYLNGQKAQRKSRQT